MKPLSLVLLVLCIASSMRGAVITLRNDTTEDRLMTAHGVHEDVAVIVPASTFVEVEVATVWFDLHEFAYGVTAGMFSIVPFLGYGYARKMFQEAE